jgi:hypothetical protein
VHLESIESDTYDDEKNSVEYDIGLLKLVRSNDEYNEDDPVELDPNRKKRMSSMSDEERAPQASDALNISVSSNRATRDAAKRASRAAVRAERKAERRASKENRQKAREKNEAGMSLSQLSATEDIGLLKLVKSDDEYNEDDPEELDPNRKKRVSSMSDEERVPQASDALNISKGSNRATRVAAKRASRAAVRSKRKAERRTSKENRQKAREKKNEAIMSLSQSATENQMAVQSPKRGPSKRFLRLLRIHREESRVTMSEYGSSTQPASESDGKKSLNRL